MALSSTFLDLLPPALLAPVQKTGRTAQVFATQKGIHRCNALVFVAIVATSTLSTIGNEVATKSIQEGPILYCNC